jgi:hypothetical protein
MTENSSEILHSRCKYLASLRSSLFWEFTQLILVVIFRSFGTNIGVTSARDPDWFLHSRCKYLASLRSSLFWEVTQLILVVIFRRFCTSIGVTSARDTDWFFFLKMLTNDSSRNFVNYQSMLRNITEDRRHHLRRDGSLKSLKYSLLTQFSNKFSPNLKLAGEFSEYMSITLINNDIFVCYLR